MIALLALILGSIICFAVFIFYVFGSIGEDTVIQTLHSPDGSRYAEVIDSDQGALGGDTLVRVYKYKTLFKDRGEIVYKGEWREYEDMEIYWKDDDTLVINSKEYPIK